MLSTTTRRTFRALALIPAAMFVAACGDDDPVAPDDPADAVEAVSLTVTPPGRTPLTYVFDQNDNPTIVLGVGANTVTSRFVDANGATVPLGANFRLDFESLTNGITFARSATDAYAGTITVPAGVTTATGVAVLWHIPSNHDDLEVPFRISVPAPTTP